MNSTPQISAGRGFRTGSSYAPFDISPRRLNVSEDVPLKRLMHNLFGTKPPLTSRSSVVDKFDQTIVTFNVPCVKGSESVEHDTDFSEVVTESKTFKIRFAQQAETLSSASMLVEKRYAWRGFPPVRLKKHPNRVNIIASTEDEIVGTLMVGYDSEEGLLGDEIYKAEIDALRAQGRRVGELSKLSMDEKHGSKQLLASMIHIAYLYGLIHDCTDSIIEIVPHHKKYYERMLGFSQIGEEKINNRVNSRVMLMHLDLVYMDQQIRRVGGTGKADKNRSLYPYFFSMKDQIGILGRLLREEE